MFSHGFYMALVEYIGGGRRSFIFIPKDRDGAGWRNLAVVLQEAGGEGGQNLLPPLSQSYRETLEALGDVQKSEKIDLLRSGDNPLSVGTQYHEGDGRTVV